MRTLSEKELDDLHKAGDKFWLEFSKLCNKYINAAPKDLQDYYAMFLGDKTSIYGRKTTK